MESASVDPRAARCGTAAPEPTATTAATTTATTTDFAVAARTLARAARRRGLVAPSFRCPPRLVGVDRSIRRRAAGAVVSIRLRDRPRSAVLADMIEGVVVTNALRPPGSDRVRAELWEVVEPVTTAPPHRARRGDGGGHDHPGVGGATEAA